MKYLDTASTSKVDNRVLDAMLPYFTEFFGNASSSHEFGRVANHAVEKARSKVAELINADSDEIIFTSGSTESINLALKGYMEANYEKGNHIITLKTEHKAVLSTCEYLESKGVEVTYLEVQESGIVDLDNLRNAITNNTILIVIMSVNNEVGVIQPINLISQIAKERDIAFFSDATQAAGKIPINVKEDNIDMLCLSAHKINGPKGVGILYKKRNINLVPLIHGGGQENGMRAGTYNTPLIVGFGKACEIALQEFDQITNRLLKLRNDFEEDFQQRNIGIVNFQNVNRAPHISSITLYNIDAEDFLLEHNSEFVGSTGSACNAEIIELSHVFTSIFGNERAKRTIRISY